MARLVRTRVFEQRGIYGIRAQTGQTDSRRSESRKWQGSPPVESANPPNPQDRVPIPQEDSAVIQDEAFGASPALKA